MQQQREDQRRSLLRVGRHPAVLASLVLNIILIVASLVSQNRQFSRYYYNDVPTTTRLTRVVLATNATTPKKPLRKAKHLSKVVATDSTTTTTPKKPLRKAKLLSKIVATNATTTSTKKRTAKQAAVKSNATTTSTKRIVVATNATTTTKKKRTAKLHLSKVAAVKSNATTATKKRAAKQNHSKVVAANATTTTTSTTKKRKGKHPSTSSTLTQHGNHTSPTTNKRPRHALVNFVDRKYSGGYMWGVYSIHAQMKKLGMLDHMDHVLLVASDLKYEYKLLLREWVGEEFVIEVDKTKLQSKIPQGLWADVFNKLEAFTLTDYDKLIVLDNDILIRQNITHWFDDYPAPAATQVRGTLEWNSGAMVIEPSTDLYNLLLDYLPQQRRWQLREDNGTETWNSGHGHQGFLSAFFSSNLTTHKMFTMPYGASVLSSDLYGEPNWYFWKYRNSYFETVHFTVHKPWTDYTSGKIGPMVCILFQEWMESVKSAPRNKLQPLKTKLFDKCDGMDTVFQKSASTKKTTTDKSLVKQATSSVADFTALLRQWTKPVATTATNDSSSQQMNVTALNKRLAQHNVSTVSCAALLHDFKTNPKSDPNEGKLYARLTDTSPEFWISVHNGNFDRIRFKIFETNGHYHETAVSDAFYELLQPGDRVVDVGGHIGWYSLLAASLGAEAAAFEPNQLNYLRLCESMCLNGWLNHDQCMHGSDQFSFVQERIHIFPYGVSNERGDISFVENKRNPGEGKVLKMTSKGTTIEGVTLDDMVKALGWTTVKILKVDVEGAEIDVFRGASQLLQSHRIRHILMEGNVRFESEKEEFQELVALLVEAGYTLYKMGGHQGPTTTNILKHGKDFASNVLKACVEFGKARTPGQCNMWWKVGDELVVTTQ